MLKMMQAIEDITLVLVDIIVLVKNIVRMLREPIMVWWGGYYYSTHFEMYYVLVIRNILWCCSRGKYN